LPLAKAKDILEYAHENNFGVLSVNVFNFESIKWVIDAAELEGSPIIAQFYPGFENYVPSQTIVAITTALAEAANVPVGVHLDHSFNYETAVKGIKDGFGSVMIDGSSLDYEANVELTRSVIKTARVFGAGVEAELGHVGSGKNIADFTNEDFFTDADQAKDFVEKTGCDFLAVAVGNAHGAYAQKPNLDIKRIGAIRGAVSVPLVLHGGSDIPDDQITEAANRGICKFNIATEYFREASRVIKALDENKSENYFGMMKNAGEPAVEFLRKKIRLVYKK